MAKSLNDSPGLEAASLPSPESVAAFLRAHPDFFATRPELLSALTPPAVDHGNRNVVDFQRAMVRALQKGKDALEAEQGRIVDVVRANMSNLARVHEGVLSLLDAPDLASLISAIREDLARMVGVDHAGIAVDRGSLFAVPLMDAGCPALPTGRIAAHMGDKATELGPVGAATIGMFGPEGSLVHSQALAALRLNSPLPDALLYFGSREASFYQPGQATDLLQFLAAVVERLVRRWASA
jgi:uncharacterized protein YigA (DUF484 family)